MTSFKVSYSLTTDGERAVGTNDDSRRKTERSRGKRELGERRGQAAETIRNREGGAQSRVWGMCILIVLAVSIARLKIRLNERWTDKGKETHLKNTVVE